MPSRRARSNSKSNKTAASQDDNDSTTTWTAHHHLVGTQLSGRVLMEELQGAAAACASTAAVSTTLQRHYTPTDNVRMTLAAFCPQQRLSPRQPALWRGVLAKNAGVANGDPQQQPHPVVYRAMDRVAKDLAQQQQQHATTTSTADEDQAAATSTTSSSCIPFSLMPTRLAMVTVEERLAAQLYQHVVEDWLPTLVLVAAIEEVNLQFLKQRQRELTISGTAAVMTSSSSRSSGKKTIATAAASSSALAAWSVPEYYRKSPSAYLTPPEPLAQQSSLAGASNSNRIKMLPVTFTPSQLVARIKQGCRLVYTTYVPETAMTDESTAAALLSNTSKAAKKKKAAAAAANSRRSSVRIAITKLQDDEPQQSTAAASASTSPMNGIGMEQEKLDPTLTWKVVNGGKIAVYLKEQLLDEPLANGTEDNGKQTVLAAAAATAPADLAVDSSNAKKDGVPADAGVSKVLVAAEVGATKANGSAAVETHQKLDRVNDGEPIEDETMASPPSSPASSMAEEDDDAKDEDEDEDFEPKDDDDGATGDADDDDASDAPVYVKENIKDLHIDQEDTVPVIGSAGEDNAIMGEHDAGDDDDDEDDTPNPYLTLTNPAILEWLGRKTSKLLTVSDIQSVFHVLLLPDDAVTATPGKKKKRRPAIGDVGEDARSLLTSMDEQIWSRILSSQSAVTNFAGSDFIGPSSRLVLRLADHHDDDNVTKWESQQFGKTNFAVGIADDNDYYASDAEAQAMFDSARREEEQFKELKAHDKWRFKGIHGGYTVWPAWSDTVQEVIQLRRVDDSDTRAEDIKMSDLALAQALADEASAQDSAARGRRTRRGGESDVFYGSQSNMTPKQLMDTLLRLISQKGFHTALGLLAAVPDESTDPLRRIRTALGRLVWKRNQLAKLTVDHNIERYSKLAIPQHPPLSVKDETTQRQRLLCRYLQRLHETELQLRRLILLQFSKVPIAIIATASDERPNSLESMDDADYENQSLIEWHASGHELIGVMLYRPSRLHGTDERSICQWYRVTDYAPAIALTDDAGENTEPSFIGNAKEPTPVERRMRFRAVPVDSPDEHRSLEQCASDSVLLLTEAQVHAGRAAADLSRKSTQPSSLSHAGKVFATGSCTRISLVPAESEQPATAPKSGMVVGHNSELGSNNQLLHKILVMPNDSERDTEAKWATLVDGASSCQFDGESPTYTIQQFDYDASSQAFNECQKIVKFLQRQDKSGLFLQPVDPIALNIPTYRSIIHDPMDISTLEARLQSGEYSNIPPGLSKYRTTIGRMLNGPFRAAVELIFDNAILFNPPGDWVHTSAAQMKAAALKRIEQSTVAAEGAAGSRSRHSSSVYVDDDSDVDMYVYESDRDEDYGNTRRSKKRKLPTDSILREDTSARAIERSYKLQKLIGDSSGLGGPLSGFPINSDAATFSLSSDWSCRIGNTVQPFEDGGEADHDDVLDNLVALHQQVEDQESSGLRRSTRAHYGEESPKTSARGGTQLEYFMPDSLSEATDLLPASRLEVEIACEKLHETVFAEAYRESSKELVSESSVGRFAEESFPPYLGRVVPLNSSGDVSWEIRSHYMIPALRWVLRGLIQSGHLGEVEPLSLDSLSAGKIIANHAYYIDERQQPFDVIDVKELQRRKRAGQEADEQAEEEVELSEYEKLRAERVARNADRLRALGLA